VPTGISNKCRLNGENVVIKCAKAATNSVGVTNKMLGELDRIIGAFQLHDDSFELFSLTPAEFRQSMRPSQSGSSGPKVALVARTFFQRNGKALGRLRVRTTSTTA
jgi:hypothetical protein